MRLDKTMKTYLTLFVILFSLMATALADDASENASKDETQYYQLYDDIYLLSAIKFSYGKPRIVVKSVFPQLQSDNDPQLASNFNQLIADAIQEDIRGYSERLADTQPKAKSKNDLYIDFDSNLLQTGDQHILSIRFTIQGIMVGNKTPYRYHHVMNYLLESQQPLSLDDLFSLDGDHLRILSEYTQKVLLKRFPNGDAETIINGTAASEDNFKNWNLKSNGLLITFEGFQVSPRNKGTQTVLVPYSLFKEITPRDSIIAACVYRKKKCVGRGVVTGGFIDEAKRKSIQPTVVALSK